MAVNNVDIYKSKIEADLNDGLTWYKKDDLGYGSIQEKYGYKEMQIATIRKHPVLKDLETTITVFNIIDDTDGPIASTPVPVTKSKNETPVESVSKPGANPAPRQTGVSENSDRAVTEGPSGGNNTASTDFLEDDSVSAFANL